jgi:hypothetical protein
LNLIIKLYFEDNSQSKAKTTAEPKQYTSLAIQSHSKGLKPLATDEYRHNKSIILTFLSLN